MSRQEDARKALATLAPSCADLGGHVWKHIGGANCGCEDGACSVPVHECTRCRLCDYGHNPEAQEVRENCPWANGEEAPFG